MSNGEVIEFDKAAAERRAERIALRLDSIADNYAAVMPMIREAIEKRDDIALGYASPGAYVADRFGGSLQRLGVEVRRTVVKELTAAGMSTRAIAPVVGVSKDTVHRDLVGVARETPEPDYASTDLYPDRADTHAWKDAQINTETGEVSDDYVTDQAELDAPFRDADSGEIEQAFDAAREQGDVSHENVVNNLPRKVTGLDGKTYPKDAPAKPRRTPLTDSIRNAVMGAETKLTTLRDLTRDDRWPRNAEEVAPRLRNDLQRLSALLEQVTQALPTTTEKDSK